MIVTQYINDKVILFVTSGLWISVYQNYILMYVTTL